MFGYIVLFIGVQVLLFNAEVRAEAKDGLDGPQGSDSSLSSDSGVSEGGKSDQKKDVSGSGGSAGSSSSGDDDEDIDWDVSHQNVDLKQPLSADYYENEPEVDLPDGRRVGMSQLDEKMQNDIYNKLDNRTRAQLDEAGIPY